MDMEHCKITLKMDVPHKLEMETSDIRNIEEKTRTSIRFPEWESGDDSTPNELSVHGFVEDVEQARALLRLTSEISISVDVPIEPGCSHPTIEQSYLRLLKQVLDVDIVCMLGLPTSSILISAHEYEAHQVRYAAELLLTECGILPYQHPMVTSFEISEEHHEILKRNHTLLNAMVHTNTDIYHRNGMISIMGSFEDMHTARQQLMGTLPIELIFDLPENKIEDDLSAKLNRLGNKYDVEISLSKRDHVSVVSIKGVEKFIGKIYKAHHEILQLETDICIAQIPKNYFAPYEISFNPRDELEPTNAEAAVKLNRVKRRLNFGDECTDSITVRPIGDIKSNIPKKFRCMIPDN